MSGPIVRTGTTPKFWKNWDKVFGKDAAAGAAGKSTKKTAAEPKAEAKKPAAKKASPKKKAAAKKKA